MKKPLGSRATQNGYYHNTNQAQAIQLASTDTWTARGLTGASLKPLHRAIRAHHLDFFITTQEKATRLARLAVL
jgi:hypothetical protein